MLEKSIKATTYGTVARGLCPYCNHEGYLRFVYNPYGDDYLACDLCAKEIDERYKDDAAEV